MKKVFVVAIGALISSAVTVLPAAAQETKPNFAVYTGSYAITVKGSVGGIPATIPATILVDTVTGRSWELIRTGEGMRWDPIHFLPTKMAGDGTPLMGGTIVPQPIGRTVRQR